MDGSRVTTFQHYMVVLGQHGKLLLLAGEFIVECALWTRYVFSKHSSHSCYIQLYVSGNSALEVSRMLVKLCHISARSIKPMD